MTESTQQLIHPSNSRKWTVLPKCLFKRGLRFAAILVSIGFGFSSSYHAEYDVRKANALYDSVRDNCPYLESFIVVGDRVQHNGELVEASKIMVTRPENMTYGGRLSMSGQLDQMFEVQMDIAPDGTPVVHLRCPSYVSECVTAYRFDTGETFRWPGMRFPCANAAAVIDDLQDYIYQHSIYAN